MLHASAAPPSPQEVHRKLSVHSAAKPKISTAPVSGTESDSDSVLTPDMASLGGQPASLGGILVGSSSYPPLSSIAEGRSQSGEESEEDDEEEDEGGCRDGVTARGKVRRDSVDASVIKAGYLWKKGERRKTWKKRWFVLRPTQLAYYKTSAEYQLLRLLDLAEVHSCTQIALKKHENTFGLVSPVRTYYLQAKSPTEVQEWVNAIQDAKEALNATSTQNSISTPPIPIPSSRGRAGSLSHPPITPSPPSQPYHAQIVTSSDSEDGSPSARRTYSQSSQTQPVIAASASKIHPVGAKDPSKIVLSGYLMKCGSKRRNWRKRWFVLNGEKLVYSGSHMDTKPHRQFSFSEIVDALEYDLPVNRVNPTLISPPVSSPPQLSALTSDDDSGCAHTFKIITTKRTLLLCAPSEEEEIKWLSAVRALIARRSGTGAVPGEALGNSAAKPMTSGQHLEVAPGQFAGLAGANSGTKGKSRRLSTSGSGAIGHYDGGALER